MKAQKPSFIIENEKLFVEQVLVSFNEVPIFFICLSENEKKRYLALDIDIEDDNYYIVQPSTYQLIEMLRGKVPMRDVFLSQKHYWEVITGEDIFSDNVSKNDIQEVQQDLLPYTNEYFEITSGQREYLCKLEKEIASASTILFQHSYHIVIHGTRTSFKTDHIDVGSYKVISGEEVEGDHSYEISKKVGVA